MTRRLLAILTVLTALAVLSSCGQEAGTIVLAPRPPLAASNVGGQAMVLLTVADDRPAGEGNVSDTLPTISQALEGQISTALKAKGFHPVARLEGATRQLAVHVTTLAYDTQTKTVTSKVTVRMALSVTATVNGRAITHDYSSASEETVAFSASQTTRERAVNSAMTALLTKLFADDALFGFLAGSQ